MGLNKKLSGSLDVHELKLTDTLFVRSQFYSIPAHLLNSPDRVAKPYKQTEV